MRVVALAAAATATTVHRKKNPQRRGDEVVLITTELQKAVFHNQTLLFSRFIATENQLSNFIDIKLKYLINEMFFLKGCCKASK
jgi:hypothetical protein